MPDPSPQDPRLGLLEGLLYHPRLGRVAILGAVLLTAPALLGPLVLDDFVLGLLSRGGGGIAGFEGRDPSALFTFTTGNPGSNRRLMAEGVLLPWWTDPHHLNAFFRPLSSLTHRIDFALFPDRPWLMHLHSLGWFLLLLAAVAALYRGVHSDHRVAPLALLLFAWDDPHGATLGWIANRNAILASALSLPAVVFHHRLAGGAARGPVAVLAGPVCFALGLCAGETAIGVLGYLLAHALCLERDSWARRVARLLPYGLVLIGWRLLYRVMGLGSGGSGAYHDPIREPLAFLAALGQNLPVLIGAQLGPPYADAAFWGPPEHHPWLLALSLAIVGIAAALALPSLRAHPEARFYALSALLAAVPVSASLPGERLLLLVGVGASGLIALMLKDYLERARRARGAGLVLVLLVGLHLVAAPIALPVMSLSLSLLGVAFDRAEASLPQDAETGDQTFILINPPFEVMASYVQPARAYRERPRPRHLQWLAPASSTLRVTREDDHSVVLRADQGLLRSPQSRHYRRDAHGVLPGDRIELPAMTVEVLEGDLAAGPRTVRFSFPTPLDAPGLRFFVFRDGRFEPFSWPPPGETVVLSPQEFFPTVLASVAHEMGL